jgi:hypothetical protein
VDLPRPTMTIYYFDRLGKPIVRFFGALHHSVLAQQVSKGTEILRDKPNPVQNLSVRRTAEP